MDYGYLCLGGTSFVARARREGRISKHRLANLSCPYCRSGDVWEINNDHPGLEFYCQSCERKFRPCGSDDEVSVGLWDEVFSHIKSKYGWPLTAYDVITSFNLEGKDKDKEITFETEEEAFQYLLTLVKYDECPD